MNKAVFLDCDGTIVEDIGYLHELSKIHFLSRSAKAIRHLNCDGFKAVIVANQEPLEAISLRKQFER